MPQFEEKLNAILSDENAMGQIMALAQSLSGKGQEEPQPEAEFPISLPDCGRDVRLLEALKPYLRPERRRKVERMLEVLQMLRLLRGGGQK